MSNTLFLLIPLMIGTIGVLQGTLNRAMGQAIGLAPALTLNSIIVIGSALILHALVRWRPEHFPEFFHDRFALSELSAWMVLPGIFGFCIIAGLPWAISKLGAARVFLAVILAQVVASMLWDAIVSKQPITLTRGLGAALTLAGVALTTLDRG